MHYLSMLDGLLLTFLNIATKNRGLNLSSAMTPEMLVGIY
jgi:hypothetical protein